MSIEEEMEALRGAFFRELGRLTLEVDRLRASVDLVTANMPLVDVGAAAKHLDVSTRTVRRLVENGKIPFRRVGRSLRFNLGQLGTRPERRLRR